MKATFLGIVVLNKYPYLCQQLIKNDNMEKLLRINLWLLMCCSLFLSSCEQEDGDWEPMKWDTKVKSSIAVPIEGGTYVFRCTNYHFFGLQVLNENGKYIRPEQDEDFTRLNGEWCTAEVADGVLTVTISPNTEAKKRTAAVGVSAGDVFDGFTFEQVGL